MEQKRDLAIVLRSVAYEERHRIITALTENHGQISALARNSIQSRRFGGALEPFAAAEWLFADKPGAELVRLDEARIRRSFEGLRKDFERLSLASVFNELMLRIAPKQQSCVDLFKLHSNALAALEDAIEGKSPEPDQKWTHDLALLNGYLAKLLQWSGSQPQLLNCLGCGTSIENIPDDSELTARVIDAGWICPRCRTSETLHVRRASGENFTNLLIRVTPTAIVDFHVSMALPIRQIPYLAQASREEHQELFHFLEALFIYHLPGFDRQPLKGLRFLGLESSVQPPPENPR